MQTIAIFGVPRSGTSWLGQIFNSHPAVAYRYQPLFSYAFKDRLSFASSPEEITSFYRDLLVTDDDFVLQRKSVSGTDTGLDFHKTEPTHLIWKEVRYLHLMPRLLEASDTRIIGIIRHPAAVLYSWVRAPKEFAPDWDLAAEWRRAERKNAGRPENFYGYERWKEAAFSMLELERQYPERVQLVVYEQLHQHPLSATESLFAFAGLEMPTQTRDFLLQSRTTSSADPYGVFRNNHRADRWRDELPIAIQKAIATDPDFVRLQKRFDW